MVASIYLPLNLEELGKSLFTSSLPDDIQLRIQESDNNKRVIKAAFVNGSGAGVIDEQLRAWRTINGRIHLPFGKVDKLSVKMDLCMERSLPKDIIPYQMNFSNRDPFFDVNKLNSIKHLMVDVLICPLANFTTSKSATLLKQVSTLLSDLMNDKSVDDAMFARCCRSLNEDVLKPYIAHLEVEAEVAIAFEKLKALSMLLDIDFFSKVTSSSILKTSLSKVLYILNDSPDKLFNALFTMQGLINTGLDIAAWEAATSIVHATGIKYLFRSLGVGAIDAAASESMIGAITAIAGDMLSFTAIGLVAFIITYMAHDISVRLSS